MCAFHKLKKQDLKTGITWFYKLKKLLKEIESNFLVKYF